MGTHQLSLSSSGSFIAGSPALVNYFESYGARYMQALRKAVEAAAREYEQKTRSRARATWGELADHITVTANPDFTLSFAIEEGYEDLATEKEYGSLSEAPAAVLRMAAINANNELASRIQADVDRYMS